VDDEQIRKHIDDGTRQGSRNPEGTAGFQVAQAEIHKQPGKEDVQHRHPLHGLVGKVRRQEEQEQIQRVEETCLHVGKERSTPVEVRIPEREHAGPEAGGCEAICWKEEGYKIAPPGWFPGVGSEENPPEETKRGDREQGNRDHNVAEEREVSLTVHAQPLRL